MDGGLSWKTHYFLMECFGGENPTIFGVPSISEVHNSYKTTPPKTNIDTKNDGLEDVSPFKHGYFG